VQPLSILEILINMKPLINTRKTSSGFTILEILISMVIVALVMTIVYSAFSAGSKVCSFGSQRAQIFHSARLAMQDIIQSIENLEYGTNDYYEFIGKSNSGTAPGGKSVDEDELEFATSTSPTFIDGRWHVGLARVKYVLAKDKKNNNSTVLEKWVADIEDEDYKDAYVLELSHNIVGMTFRFHDENDFDDSWDSDTKEKLPEFVEITFYVSEGESVSPFRSGALIPNMRVGKKVKNAKDSSEDQKQPANVTPGGPGTTAPKPKSAKKAPAAPLQPIKR